ncbi:asparagine synthetase B family protein [Sinosporangium siamense]|uniref:asparagine synthase (glutamine-hydrolyzing) n=1 Tax=Sinosporangium siamense TaxID=1367973 RepID=A0A919RFC1_9ACTN|nr:asparagine synthase-related protein [Sinosporangium siamense]GII92848.1 asparagine synthetase B [Sinosporangium siamense]
MSGLAGWADFQRDLTTERGVVLAQLGTLAARGPDGEDLWSSPHAVLGCRHGFVGGGPRLVVAYGDAVVVALDGRIVNAASLRTELSGYGRYTRIGDDTDLVGHAYLHWGDRFADHLEGAFATVLWHPRVKRLILVRDRFGTRPLYYHRTDEGLVFGSEPKAVMAHPQVEAVANTASLRELLASTATPGSGILRGLHRVFPGGQLTFDRDGMREHRYWRLAAAPHHHALHTTVGMVRELLEASVEKQIGDDTPGVLLSGGLASSATAALAAAVLDRWRARPLRTFTAGFPEVGPVLPGPMRGLEDRPHAAAVAEHLGTEHLYLPLCPSAHTDPTARGSAVAAQQDTPVAAPQFPASLRMLCRQVSRHTRTVLGGHRANIVFANTAFGPVTGDAGAPPTGSHMWSAMPGGRMSSRGLGTGLFSPGLLDELDLAAYRADTHLTDVAAAPRLSGESPLERRMREITYSTLQGRHELATMLDDGASSIEGVDLRSPFSDHRLVEYVFNVPWAMKRFDGRPQTLLRAAVCDLLPDSIMERPPSPFPIGRHPGYGVFLRRRLADVLADPGSPVLPLLDVTAARRLIKEPIVTARTWIDVTNMEMALQVNRWLEQFSIRLAI